MRLQYEMLSKEEEAEKEQCLDGFWVKERARFRYIGDKWSWKTEKVPTPWRKTYPLEFPSDDKPRAVFLCRDGLKPVGQLTISMWWNYFACIESICVLEPYRQKGIASILLQMGRDWAKSNAARGLYFETQDTNVPVMRFCEKNGFQIHGINTMLYYNSPHRTETAVFYYELFENENELLSLGTPGAGNLL